MEADKILFIDTETGGLDPSVNSLLSMAFVVWRKFKIVAVKEILINDGILNVTEKALEINGIVLEEHKKVAVNPSEAIIMLDQFLDLHFHPDEKITLGGHNINFDVNFIKNFLSKNGYNFNRRFSHRYVDTATILYYLYLSNKIAQKAISSQEAFDFFGITVENRHTALSDAVATTKLFTILLKKIYKNVKLGGTSKPNLFEPDLIE